MRRRTRSRVGVRPRGAAPEARAAERRVVDDDRAAVALDDRLHHREPEPDAAGVTSPALVESGEAVEHPVAVGGGDPRTVVVDGEPDRAVDRGEADLDTFDARGAHALSSRLRTTRRELGAAAVDPSGRDAGSCRPALGTSARVSSSTTSSRSTSIGSSGAPSSDARQLEQLARRRLRAARPPRGPASATTGQSASAPRGARPRAARGWTPPGCAARAMRPTRTGAGAATTSSSRSSIEFMVRASRPISSSVLGSGTRRWIVEPVMAAASARIDSTGRSARPVSHQVRRRRARRAAARRARGHVRDAVDGAVDLVERLFGDERDRARRGLDDAWARATGSSPGNRRAAAAAGAAGHRRSGVARRPGDAARRAGRRDRPRDLHRSPATMPFASWLAIRVELLLVRTRRSRRTRLSWTSVTSTNDASVSATANRPAAASVTRGAGRPTARRSALDRSSR